MDRRHFLKMAGLTSMVMMSPFDVLATPGKRRVLVLVELKGGNDGLNTVVPFADQAYYRLRPGIAIKRDEVLKLDEKVGLHPSLKGLHASFKKDEVAIVQGVGYDDPNRSHFRSIEIWETASKSDEFLEDGWLARAMGNKRSGDLLLDGVSVGEQDPGPMRGDPHILTFSNPEQMTRASKKLLRPTDARSENDALMHILDTQREILRASSGIEEKLATTPALGVSFPSTRLGKELEVAARLIVGDVPVMVIRVSHGSFDTHANQQGQHARLLQQLDEALVAFRQSLVKHSRWSDTLVMTYSEFGRRASQNASRGTDHGTAAPHFLMGGNIKGGLHGQAPSLTDLAGGDLEHHVDFRHLYSTAATGWLGLKADELKAYKPLPVL